ncbi:hypothetical protein G7077_11040 [Sphingomonas piscis]|uniref:Uncharacterized protein n=1 Tax=Sphingomonas piscis TaxID=2714943 RepID=A0A6G7YRI5_9SPHN|nr:hypothetical protein [Sphingomonas piscis]QIK79358.1 hypothetical protein G7077_11040 [Sphingomonas piscis]
MLPSSIPAAHLNHEHELSAQQVLEAQQALDVAAFNGILSLAIILRKRHLLTDLETGNLHEIMSRPLSMTGNASNPVVQDAQHNLDQLFALLVK